MLPLRSSHSSVLCCPSPSLPLEWPLPLEANVTRFFPCASLALVLTAGCPTSKDGVFVCEEGPVIQPGDNFFRDISESSGIQEENHDWTRTDIPINDHSRLAFSDINGDGYPDIAMHTGRPGFFGLFAHLGVGSDVLVDPKHIGELEGHASSLDPA